MNAPENENDPRHLKLLEAILFASAEPLSERALSHRLPEGVNLEALLGELQGIYADRGVNLVRGGGSWAFRTAPDLAQQLNMEIDVPRKLSRAAFETLAIIAYHQPVTRAEVEEIRGVSLSRGTLDVLLEAGWIRPKGRRRTPGRPTTWGTTDGFLDHFGIEDIHDLPGMDELKAAGLLDSGPAISIYQSRDSNRNGGDGDEGSEGGGAQFELIESPEDDGREPAERLNSPSTSLDDPEPLDSDGGEEERA